ncbi:hypothetical protein ['Prunus avium' virescence phytoplasma]|uniref:hypothetical protein n=1 Tax='Prunus avium' virescence phytoplasma TaxID=2056121 RepID=UPI003D802E64
MFQKNSTIYHPFFAIAAIIWFYKYTNNTKENIEPSSPSDLEFKSEKDNEDKTKENNEEKKEDETIFKCEPKNQKLSNEKPIEIKIEGFPKKDTKIINLSTDNLDLREVINEYKRKNQLNNDGKYEENKISKKLDIKSHKIELYLTKFELTNIFINKHLRNRRENLSYYLYKY